MMYGREAKSAHLPEDLPFSDDGEDETQIRFDFGNKENKWNAQLIDNRAESIA